MKRLAICLLAVSAFALSVSGAAAKVVRVTDAQNDSTVALSKGDALEVSLPGNITTGFSWAITSVAGKAVAPTGKVEYAAKPTGLVGAPGVFTAKFNAVNAGKSVVCLAYRRPWEEKKKKAARLFVLTVSVKK
jgi:predicted secreted protein